jgi:hypothetical protein
MGAKGLDDNDDDDDDDDDGGNYPRPGKNIP